MSILAQNEQNLATGLNRPTPTRLEAWAEMEQHFAEQDRLIAAWLAPSGSRRLNVAHVTGLRETRFAYWRHLEDRAHTEPRLLDSQDRAAREYLTGYVRPSVRHANLMERACPIWLVLSVMGVAALWFFVPALFPGAAESALAWLKGFFL